MSPAPEVALALVDLAQEAPTPEQLEACGDTPSLVCRLALDATGSDTTAEIIDFAVAKPLKVLFILAMALVVSRLARRAIRRFVKSFESPEVRRHIGTLRDRTPNALLSTGPVQLRAVQRAETIAAVLRSATTSVIWAVAGMMVLSEFSINLGPLIAGAGIAGVALGFGAQTLVKDFLSGMFMLMEDQFGVGDIVDVGEASGVVEGVSLRTTRLRDVEGTVWHVPNGQILRVGNKSQQWSRALVDFEVAYSTDIEQAKATIKRVADELVADVAFRDSVLEPPEVWGVERFGPDGVAIRLVIKTRPADQFTVMRELRQRMKAAFDADGIEIPFPQRTMWVRQADGVPPSSSRRPGAAAPDHEPTGG